MSKNYFKSFDELSKKLDIKFEIICPQPKSKYGLQGASCISDKDLHFLIELEWRPCNVQGITCTDEQLILTTINSLAPLFHPEGNDQTNALDKIRNYTYLMDQVLENIDTNSLEFKYIKEYAEKILSLDKGSEK